MSAAPTIEEWSRIGSTVQENHWATIKRLKYILWSLHRAMCSWLWWKDKFCLEYVRQSEGLKYEIAHDLNYKKQFKKRKTEYLISVSENNPFIKAELDFTSTKFIDE